MTATADSRARVVVRTRPIWLLRLRHGAPRYTLGALSVLGLLASARFAIAPPRPASPAAVRSAGVTQDLAAQGYAVEFARRYLTWSASEPLGSSRGLEPFAGAAMEPGAGITLPTAGEEQVLWAEAVQTREPITGTHVYTVAAETTSEGLRYITVPVARTPMGALAITGYPAFVGAPASSPALLPARLPSVDDPVLERVVRRGLANYLADSPVELAADLAEGASVAPPSPGLRLLSVERQQWAPGGGAVLASVVCEDRLGARYTLQYELDVARAQGRWEISAIQTDPDA